MPEPEGQHMPDVSTEPQRQALDEMSRQLVEKLNEMVREQNERARRFATQQHSLSPLPGQMEQPVTPQPTAESSPLPQPPAPQPTPADAKKKRKFPFLAQQPVQQKKPQDFAAPALSGDFLAPYALKKNEAERDKKSEESGCGTIPTIVFIIILVIIFRSCS